MCTKKLLAVLMMITVLMVSTNNANAKSVYAIIDHGYPERNAKIAAYDVNDDQIDLQKTLTLDQNDYPTGSYFGPVGMAIDSESEYMFVTHERKPYEGIEGIQLINAKTMVDEGVIEVQGAPDLAGIVFDNERRKVYTVEKGTNKLFVLLWDAQTKTLTLEGGEPKTLAGIGDLACGLALDEIDDILYVTSIDFHSAVFNVVHYYDVNDPNWTHKGSIEIVVDSNDRYAVGIAVYNDGQGTKYLYTGAYDFFESYDYLVRTDINDINNPSSTEKDIGASAIGIAVDDDTGLVYVTTSNNHIEVYNPLTWPSDPCCIEDANISGPAGICVPTGDVSYKPGLLTLSKIDDVNDGNCVSPGDYITYTITYGNPVTDPNDPNYIGIVNDVNIVDYLPVEVDYTNPFDPNYNSVLRTYTWNIGVLSPGDSNYVTLTVKVNKLAEPLGTIHNYCEIECDIAYNTADVNTPVCWWSPDIIYVDVNAVGSNTGLSWYHADPNLQRALQKAQAWDSNQIWVAAGTYKPTTEQGDYSTVFELVNGVDFYGGFAGYESAITQRNLMINETILDGNLPEYGVSYVVGANDVNETTIIDGFTITNGWWMGIYSVNSSLIIGHNRIIDNGYGICCINLSSVNVTNCDIINNRGRTNVHGGGIYCEDSNSLIVTNCIISENTSDANGGGIYFNDSSSLTVMDCTISGNQAGNYGGGMYCKDSNNVTITRCIITGNSVEYSGGGVYDTNSILNVSDCILTGNSAGDFGGGIANYPLSSLTISNCILCGNSADGYGGGAIGNAGQSSATTICNCTLSGNYAYGGSYGGGMCNWESSPMVTNCIFWDNEAVTDYNEIYNNENSHPDISYSDIKGGWAGAGNINKDPCFFDVEQSTGSWTDDASYDSSTCQSTLTDADANWAVNELAGKFVNPDTSQALQFFIVSNDVNTIKVWSDVESIAGDGDTYQIYDYHLSSDSNCIDAGDPDFNPDPNMTDIDGEPRVVDGDGDPNETEIVDMGADEYYWSPADFNSDGIVNFFDYALFASAWQSEPNDDNYNEDCDLEDNNSIDYNDLALFCEDWLWQTAWAKTFPCSYGQGMGRSMGLGMSESLSLTEELYPSAPAKQQPAVVEPLDIEEIIKWLDELWLTNDELRKMISEDEWLKFIWSVINSK